MNKILFLLSFSLFLISNKAISQVNQTENNFDLEQSKKRLTEEINKVLKETGIPSISLSLIKDDAIIWSEAFGYANVKKKLPATSSTIYSTGSNFKFVTATAIMQLAEAGKLDIDNPINNYLGESAIDDLSSEGTPVTFRHLLSHHSGLKGPIEIIPIWERKIPKTLEEIASEISAEEPPGINFKYCNHCYALAGLAIEKISGQTFQEYIVKHILEPLQIDSKGPVIPTPSMVEELALPYSLKNNKSVPEYQSRFDVFPAGDIYLTAREMANFYIAQLNQGSFKGQSILNSKSVTMMQEAQFGSSYGLGTGVIIKDDVKYLQHTGGVPGFSTFFKVEPTSKTGVYIASNSSGVQSILGEIGNLSLKLINGETEIDPLQSFAKKEFEEIQLTEDVLKKYTGKYQLAPDFIITVTQEGESIYAQPTGQEKFELFAYGEDKFFLKVVYAQVKFNTENGKITSLTLFQDGETIGKKIE
jgi:CubicO group peptidase (beta-lactamase class C family)